jgi:hypothetical protein
MMTPDHDPEFGFSLCPASAAPEAKQHAAIQIRGKFVLMMSRAIGSTATLFDISTTVEQTTTKWVCCNTGRFKRH